MRRNIVCALLAMVMMFTMGFGFAEQAQPAQPSKTVADLVVSTASGEEATVTVAVEVLKPESEEAVVFEEIAAFVETANVIEYFDTFTQAVVATTLPAETDLNSLQLEEFFELKQEGYEDVYGDVTATFEFVTPYEEDAVLVAMVGLLPKAAEETAETEEEAKIVWYPQQTVVVDGKVQIIFTQDVLALMQEQTAVLALLRVYPTNAL